MSDMRNIMNLMEGIKATALAETVKEEDIARLDVNDEGYDDTGAYWGAGDPVWQADVNGETVSVRAADMASAKAKLGGGVSESEDSPMARLKVLAEWGKPKAAVASTEHHEIVPAMSGFDVRRKRDGKTVGMGFGSESEAMTFAELKDSREDGSYSEKYPKL